MPNDRRPPQDLSPDLPSPPPGREDGVALIMVVIFSVLLSVLVMELATTARQAAATSDNDVKLALMENHMQQKVFAEILQQLADDLTAAAEGEGESPLPTGGPGGLPGGPPGGGEGGPGGEETPPSDSFNDSYLKPQAFADGDLTTYVMVVDENRKFNLLSLLSPDEAFARDSRERLVRLIRAMRENTPYEITSSRAESIATAITSWLKGEDRNDSFRPKPKLKSDDEKQPRHTIPLHMEELLLLREIDRQIFDDLVYDEPPLRVLPGLASVLTIYTSYRKDPGDPEKLARNNRNNPSSGGNNAQNPANPGSNATEKPQPEGIGIRINVNTAPRCVLRSLMSPGQIPDTVIDAIIEYRNEEAPEEEGAEEAAESLDTPSDIREGLDAPKQIFNSLEDLEKVPEFANLSDRELKDKFLRLLSTESDVFTIHMACLFKRSEERKIFVLNRRRSVIVRLEGSEEPRMHPILRLERYKGRTVFLEDIVENQTDREMELAEMDEFSLEERKWNPFYKDFYKHAQRQKR